MGVRARARGARPRRAPRTLRALRRRRRSGAAIERVVRVDLAVDGGGPVRSRAGGRGGRRSRREFRAGSIRRRLGEARSLRAREVPLPNCPHHPGALQRTRGRRVARRWQADTRVARRRPSARGRPLLLLRGLGGQARVRLPQPHAAPARSRGTDHPLELPAAHALVEDRPGPRLREHRRAEAGRDDPADRVDLRGHLPAGGASAGRGEHRHR